MTGSVSDDYGIERSSDLLTGQHGQSGEALAEWRLCEQVDNGTPSTSPPYWDTDEDNDGGPKPSELYGRYTWKIEKFSQTSKRELKSEVFDVGGYKWYILIYPQGCDVCNHLSLFLCVANHDKLLPGWSHFAQFTIAVVNKDPKKSKYSDTLHRFWKKEHDWGWKKFMELSKVQDGFIVADTLEIRAQVQIIREKAHRPFRCLDRQYRRELVRVYLTNVEQICRHLVEERRAKLVKLIGDKVRWLSFNNFWLGVDQSTKDCMSREKTDVIMRVVVKNLFVEKEVTSTLVMDSLNSGLKALVAKSKSKQGKSNLLETVQTPAPFISLEDDMFVLADDVLTLLERAALEPLPPKDDKGPQNRTKEGNSGEDFNKDSMERDERRLTELGRKTIEAFVLDRIYSEKIEVAYQEDVALKRQEELIREEEAAGQAEFEQKEKRRIAEKEKRSKKKMNKQRRSNRKGKDRGKDEKFDLAVQEKHQSSLIKERNEEIYSVELAESMPEKNIAFEAISDVSDIDDDVSETAQLEIEDKHASSINWDADSSEALPSMELCGRSSLPLENGYAVTSPSSMDDSSSTCSTDSVPSVVSNGPCKRNSSTNYRTQKSPSREKNHGAMKRHERAMERHEQNRSRKNNNLLRDPTMFAGNGNAASKSSNSDESELKVVLSSKDHIQKPEQHLIKKDAFVSSQHIVKEQANIDKPSKQMTAVEVLSSPRDPTRNYAPLLQSKSVLNGNITSNSVRGESSTNLPQNDTMVTPMQLPQTVVISQPEIKKNISSKPLGLPEKNATRSMPPFSAPIVPNVRPTAPMVSMVQTAQKGSMVQTAPMVSMVQTTPMASMVQTAPMASMVQTAPMASMVQTPLMASMVQSAPALSWSVSAVERLDSDSSPAIQSSGPRSYRGTGQANTLTSHMSGLLPTSSLMASPLLYSQPPALALTLQNSTGMDHGLATSGFTFGSVTPEVLHNQPQWTEASQGSSSTPAVGSGMLGPHNLDSYRAINSGIQTDFTEFPTSFSSRQAQKASLDEFPHLDIINYLFDEELGNGKESNGATISAGPGSDFHHHMGHQIIFPNDMSTLVQMGSTINGHFEQPMAYYDDDAQPVYGAFTNQTNGLTDVALPVDFSIYGNGHFDGIIQNQWPVGYGSNLCLVSDGYPFHMPEYPNLACGVGGYAVFQPSSGH